MVASIIIFATIASVLSAIDITTCDDTQECEDFSWVTNNQHLTCRGYQSCLDGIYIATSYQAKIYGFQGAQDSTIGCSIVYAYGPEALLDAKVTAASSVYLYGVDSGKSAVIYTPNVYAYGYQSASGAQIQTQTAALNVRFYGYQSGYNTQIKCLSGDTCTVECTGDACHVSTNPTTLYCYNGAICKPVCEDETQCPNMIGGPESELTDPQIHEIYLRDRKRIDGLRKPQSYEYQPKDVSKWILSFSASQFTLLCILNALFVFVFVGLCLWNVSTAKKKHDFTKKVDYA